MTSAATAVCLPTTVDRPAYYKVPAKKPAYWPSSWWKAPSQWFRYRRSTEERLPPLLQRWGQLLSLRAASEANRANAVLRGEKAHDQEMGVVDSNPPPSGTRATVDDSNGGDAYGNPANPATSVDAAASIDAAAAAEGGGVSTWCGTSLTVPFHRNALVEGTV